MKWVKVRTETPPRDKQVVVKYEGNNECWYEGFFNENGQLHVRFHEDFFPANEEDGVTHYCVIDMPEDE